MLGAGFPDGADAKSTFPIGGRRSRKFSDVNKGTVIVRIMMIAIAIAIILNLIPLARFATRVHFVGFLHALHALDFVLFESSLLSIF